MNLELKCVFAIVLVYVYVLLPSPVCRYYLQIYGFISLTIPPHDKMGKRSGSGCIENTSSIPSSQRYEPFLAQKVGVPKRTIVEWMILKDRETAQRLEPCEH